MADQRMALASVVALVLLSSAGAFAEESSDTPLPRPRPDASATLVSAPDLPLPRPAAPATSGTEIDTTDVPSEQAKPRIYQTACPAVFSGKIAATALPPVTEGLCQVRSPLSLTGIVVNDREVPLSNPAVIGCALAGQVAEWVTRVDAYARAVFNSGVAQLHVGTSYECRARNHQEDAPMSEHAFADALDVTGFTLVDGRALSLPDDWAGNGAEARAMRYAHDAACGLFTTVLGPDANSLHKDHLHLDLGCHGATCTYRICE